MKIEVITKPQDIKNEWEKLVPQSETATFFQTYDWAQVWWRNFHKGGPYILLVKDQKTVAIAPFLKSGGKLVFWGTEPILGEELVTDYGDIIAQKDHEERVWQAILDYLRPQKLTLELHFLREHSPSFNILKQKTQGKIFHEEVSLHLNLPKSWEEYLLGLERKKRQELERKMRRLQNAGSFRIIPLKTSKDDLNHFFHLVRLSNDEKGRFLTPKMEDFFRDFIQVFQAKKTLGLNFLEFEGQKIAVALSFVFGDEVLLYNSGFDSSYSYLAPGFLLKALLIKKVIEEGRKKFDFLRGAERYKYDLGAREEDLYCLRINL